MLLVVDGIKIEDKDDKIRNYFNKLMPIINERIELKKIHTIDRIYDRFTENTF